MFQHTVNLPALWQELEINCLRAVGVSTRPRNVAGSYMPCFLVGEGVAEAVAKTNGIPLYKTSHQVGHILAALFSADRMELCQQKHIAFHLSGGTTEALLVTPDKEEIIKADIIAQSLDLKAGQAIDRAGVMLGIPFPCGKALDALSMQSDRTFSVKPSMKGLDCSLSGVENKAQKMLSDGAPKEDIAKLVLTCVAQTVAAMLRGIQKEYGDLPVVFSGGVSSNSLLRQTVSLMGDVCFAAPEYSLDNAAGVAVYAYMKEMMS